MHAYSSRRGKGNFNQSKTIIGSTHHTDYSALGPLQKPAVVTNLTLTANPWDISITILWQRTGESQKVTEVATGASVFYIHETTWIRHPISLRTSKSLLSRKEFWKESIFSRTGEIWKGKSISKLKIPIQNTSTLTSVLMASAALHLVGQFLTLWRTGCDNVSWQYRV